MAFLVLARARAAWLAAILVVGDLLSFHDRLNLTAARELYLYRPPALDAVRPSPHARVYVYDYFDDAKAAQYLGHRSPYLTATPQQDWPVPWLEALALRTVLYPTVAGAWNLETAYNTDALGLYAPPLALITTALREVEGTPLHTRLLRIGAVEYVVALHRQGFFDLTPVATLPTLFVETLQVLRVPDPLPRTYAVARARSASSLTEELRALAEPSFDPAREVMLGSGAAAGAADFSGTSRIVDF